MSLLSYILRFYFVYYRARTSHRPNWHIKSKIKCAVKIITEDSKKKGRPSNSQADKAGETGIENPFYNIVVPVPLDVLTRHWRPANDAGRVHRHRRACARSGHAEVDAMICVEAPVFTQYTMHAYAYIYSHTFFGLRCIRTVRDFDGWFSVYMPSLTQCSYEIRHVIFIDNYENVNTLYL